MIDLAPLREVKDFRLLYIGHVATLLCIGVMGVACNSQIYALSGSSFQVGLVNGAIAVSATLFLFLGGALADRWDRRWQMFWARTAFILVSILLLANTLSPAPALWPIYLAACLSGATGGISAPAFVAAIPMLVGRERLVATGALNATAVQIGAILGPLLAAGMIARWGLAACYLFCTLGVILTPAMIFFIRPLPPEGRNEPDAPKIGVGEAFRFIRGDRVIAGLLLIDVAAVLFAMPFAVFPQLADERLGGGAAMVGFLHTAFAVGAMAAALFSGWMSRSSRRGMILLGATLLWGAAIFLSGLAESPMPVLAALAVAGFANTVAEILRGAALQARIPDRLMGRVASLWMMQASLGPALAGGILGFLAGILSPGGALLVGGIASLLGTAGIALLFRPLWRRG